MRVAATNEYHELAVAATLAIGGTVGVGVGVGVHIVNLTTDAYINNLATVRASNNVNVLANGTDTIIGVVAGASAGEVGVAGTVSVTLPTVHTYADTGHNVTIIAGGNVNLSASDGTNLLLITASLAGGYVGVGVAVGVADLNKDTEAFIGQNSFVVGRAGVGVQSASNENVFGLAASVGVGFVGVAGGIGVTLLHVTTMAFVDSGADINCMTNCTGTDGTGSQSVNVDSVGFV